MTWGEILGIVAVIAAIALPWFLMLNYRRHRDNEIRIYEEAYQNQHQLPEPISPGALKSYGFTIYDTKGDTYALKGFISMHQRTDYWETLIQGPGRVMWKDTHMDMDELRVFCAKHGIDLIKSEEEE